MPEMQERRQSVSSIPPRSSSIAGGSRPFIPTAITSPDRSESHHQNSTHSRHSSDADLEAHRSKGTDASAAASDPPRLGQESFWSPRLKQQRAGYFKGIVGTTVMICILIWGVVAIYWGSLWKEYDLSTNLHGWIINRDAGGIVGDALQNALIQANTGPKPHITWKVVDPARYPTTADLDYEVAIELSAYGIVEIAANATAKLEQARATGDATWDPTSLVSLIYASARNAQVVPSVVVAPAQQTINHALATLSTQLAASFFSNPPANVATLVARAPQTIASPIVLLPRDIRHYDTPVAIAVLLVGLIYLCILTFNVTMANFGVRQPLQPFLRYRSLVAMRILVPMSTYVIISLMITLLNVAFELPFGRVFSYGAGFMIWWCTTFVGMTIMGLVTETFISLVGPRFIAFLLLFFIIINVSVANFPIEISPSFYRYGYAMPFYNIRMIYNTVIFDVGKRVLILKYMGILWAWLAVIFLTFPIWIWREQKAAQKARSQKAGPGVPPH
ncbi:hypothetical protein ACQY0O_003284 [Thecaphora frezii]